MSGYEKDESELTIDEIRNILGKEVIYDLDVNTASESYLRRIYQLLMDMDK